MRKLRYFGKHIGSFLERSKVMRLVGLLLILVLLLGVRTPSDAAPQTPCPYNPCQSGQSCSQWYMGDPGTMCCVTACDAEHRATNLNPSWPRTAMQRPGEPQKDMVNCQISGPSDGATPYLHSRYDLLAFTGISDGCTIPSYTNLQGNSYYANSKGFAQEIKAFSPETIVLGKPGYSPIGLGEDSPIEYFVLKNRSTTNTSNVTANSTSMSIADGSWFYDKKGWLSFINGDTFRYNELDGNNLNDVWGLDNNHAAGQTVQQPVEVFGYTPNLMPFNPLADYRDVAKFTVDQRYAGFTEDDFQYYDGVFYSEMRDRILCADDMCGATHWSGLEFGADFNNNGIRDCDCDDTAEFTMSYLDEQWHIGVEAMFRYEREVLEDLMPGRTPIIVTNSGDPAGDYMADFNNGFQVEYLRKIWDWSAFRDKLQYWEQNAPQPHAIVIIDTTKQGDYDDYISEGRNDFAQVRYGIATASMGDAFYGRNFGWYHYMGLWYDEYETDLGYPISPPIEIKNLHTDPASTGIQPDWQTYEYINVRFFDKGAVIVNPTGTPQTVTEADLKTAWTQAGFPAASFPGYYRFKGGQDPDFNNGERFTSIDLRGDPGPAPQGCGDDKSDGILLFTEPVTAVADIVVGNWHNDDTSPGSDPVVLEPRDAWDTISYSDDKYGANPYYTQWVAGWTEEGTPYFYTSGAGKTATFRPTIGVAGEYHVYEWHGWHAARSEKPETHQEASNIQATIQHAGGTSIANVDQTGNYGQWNYLGTYYFNRGTDGFVRYSTDGADGVVIADTVMFQFAGDNESPPTCSPDLNQDSRLNVLDLQTLINLTLHGNPDAICADLNGDSKVDQNDVQFLVRKILQ